MPSLRPSSPLTMVMFPENLELDLDVDAGRKVQAHEGVDGLVVGLQNVDEPLVRTDLELLTGVLVLEGAADDGVLVDLRRKGDGTGHAGAGALCRIDDVGG